MTELQASRTLVKSPPELWAECSDAAALARHLGAFGEIRITRLDPETAVAWEGENVRGTVRIEPAGWGTKVILTAERPAGEVAAVAADRSEPAVPEPAAADDPPEPELPSRRRFTRLRAFFRAPERVQAASGGPEPSAGPPEPEAEQEPAEPVSPVEPPAEFSQPAAPATEAALTAALDSLGQAHHRPYSRA